MSIPRGWFINENDDGPNEAHHLSQSILLSRPFRDQSTSQRPAFHLAGSGIDTHVITSRQLYDEPNAQLTSNETVRDVHIHRVATTFFGRSTLWERSLDYISYYFSTTRSLFALTRPAWLIMRKFRPPSPFSSNPRRSRQELPNSLLGYGHLRSLGEDDFDFLEKRLGRLHAKLRLGIEADHEAQVFGQGINYFHIENLPSSHLIIRACLKLTGLYWRGRRNAAQIEVRDHYVTSPQIPKAFDGFTILHLSDLHVDISQNAMTRLTAILKEVSYDLCVLTGDYRGQSFGSYEAALAGMSRICAELKKPAYGVLGNHDTVCMVRGLEEMGIRMLLNEHEQIKRNDSCIYLAGIDDAHFYRADNIEKAASGIPTDEFSILLSHTPEIYQQAALADFKVLLSGHTHGGQICLPGQIPVTLGSVLPRHMGAGPWKHRAMIGYTSVGAGSCVVPVRFNCPPEITLHRLQATE